HAEAGGAHLAPPQAQHEGALVPGHPENPLLSSGIEEHFSERWQRNHFRHGGHRFPNQPLSVHSTTENPTEPAPALSSLTPPDCRRQDSPRAFTRPPVLASVPRRSP